jgi:phage recombination protein Bet
MNEVTKLPQRSIVSTMALRFGMEPGPFEATVRATCNADKLTREQFAAFLLVAHEHGLNPITREIFAFPGKGGVIPIVSVDGWLRILNSHPQLDGMEIEEIFGADKKIEAVCVKLYRKDRKFPVSVTEYAQECARDTEVWRKWPVRMLRHKALIQAARYTFGFAGIFDQDEAERIEDVTAVDVPQIERKSAYQARKDGDWQKLIVSLQECETVEGVEAWEKAWAEDIAKIPLQWQFELSEAKEKHVEEIAAREEADRQAERALRNV